MHGSILRGAVWMRKRSNAFASDIGQVLDSSCAIACAESSTKKCYGRVACFRGRLKADRRHRTAGLRQPDVRRQTSALDKPNWKSKVRGPKSKVLGPRSEVRRPTSAVRFSTPSFAIEGCFPSPTRVGGRLPSPAERSPQMKNPARNT